MVEGRIKARTETTSKVTESATRSHGHDTTMTDMYDTDEWREGMRQREEDSAKMKEEEERQKTERKAEKARLKALAPPEINIEQLFRDILFGIVLPPCPEGKGPEWKRGYKRAQGVIDDIRGRAKQGLENIRAGECPSYVAGFIQEQAETFSDWKDSAVPLIIEELAPDLFHRLRVAFKLCGKYSRRVQRRRMRQVRKRSRKNRGGWPTDDSDDEFEDRSYDSSDEDK